MTYVRTDADIALNDGLNRFEIDTERDIEVTFRAGCDCDVLVRVKKAGKLRIRTFTPRGVHVSYLFWNEAQAKIEADETHDVMGNADLTVAYAEVNGADTDRNVYVALRAPGAHAHVSTASLVNEHKNYRINVVNFAPHTAGEMENYAVVLKNGRLMIDCIGKIVKGASGSVSKQTSRALSFEDGQRSEILPELLIDEDDVQASHAMSMGRVDEDQLYYMMSRGLSVQECTSLISTGYLLPITKTLSDEAVRTELKEEMERKISGLC